MYACFSVLRECSMLAVLSRGRQRVTDTRRKKFMYNVVESEWSTTSGYGGITIHQREQPTEATIPTSAFVDDLQFAADRLSRTSRHPTMPWNGDYNLIYIIIIIDVKIDRKCVRMEKERSSPRWVYELAEREERSRPPSSPSDERDFTHIVTARNAEEHFSLLIFLPKKVILCRLSAFILLSHTHSEFLQ